MTLNTNGYIIYATGSMTNNGTIEDNGVSAVGFNDTQCTPSATCTQAGAPAQGTHSLAAGAAGGNGGGGASVPSYCT